MGGHISEPGLAQASVAGGLLLYFSVDLSGTFGVGWVGFSRVLIVACFWFGSPGDFGTEIRESPDFLGFGLGVFWGPELEIGRG